MSDLQKVMHSRDGSAELRVTNNLRQKIQPEQNDEALTLELDNTNMT